MKKILTIFMVMTGFVFAVVSPSAAEDDKNMDAAIEKYITSHPEVIVDTLQRFYDKKRREEQETQFKQSLQSRVQVPLGDAPSVGPKDAKITLVEFSDFQCPFCARASATLQKLRKKYPKDLRIVFKHLPLSFHPKAIPASKAAMAARAQGKFWPYRDLLMEKQREWGNGNEQEFFIRYAKEMGMDTEKFKTDMARKEYKTALDKDVALAKKLGISGTPTFFLNGVRVSGARPQEHFELVIQTLLKEKS